MVLCESVDKQLNIKIEFGKKNDNEWQHLLKLAGFMIHVVIVSYISFILQNQWVI